MLYDYYVVVILDIHFFDHNLLLLCYKGLIFFCHFIKKIETKLLIFLLNMDPKYSEKEIEGLTNEEKKLLDILPDAKEKLDLGKLIREIAEAIERRKASDKKEWKPIKHTNFKVHEITPKDFLNHHIIQKIKRMLEIKEYNVELIIVCSCCGSSMNDSFTFDCKKCKKARCKRAPKNISNLGCYIKVSW